jgi:hypothetical protein
VFVQRVVLPDSRRESWAVLGDDGCPVEGIDRYLAYLSDIERSPNTVKAYAHDLKDWFVFLGDRAPDWRDVRLEDVGSFVAWLRLPPMIRSGGIAVLPSVEHHCGETTVNRKLSAVSAFYQHAARNGVELGELLTSWQPAGSSRDSLAALPSPHLQGPAPGPATDPTEGVSQATEDPHPSRGPGHLGQLSTTPGPALVRRALRHRHAHRRGPRSAP